MISRHTNPVPPDSSQTPKLLEVLQQYQQQTQQGDIIGYFTLSRDTVLYLACCCDIERYIACRSDTVRNIVCENRTCQSYA